jgi:hypothetical protein
VLYPLLFVLAAPATAFALQVPGLHSLGPGPVPFLVPVIVALVIAELIAAIRPVRGPRVALLTRRHWRDLVPRWAIAVLLALAAIAVALAVLALSAQSWANEVVSMVPATGDWTSPDGVVVTNAEHNNIENNRPVALIVLVGVAFGLAAVLGLVRLAVRRRAIAGPQVDAALRARSARVAVGIGLPWMTELIILANNRLAYLRSIDLAAPGFPPAPGWLANTTLADFVGMLAILVAAGGWIFVANAPRRLPAVQAAA